MNFEKGGREWLQGLSPESLRKDLSLCEAEMISSGVMFENSRPVPFLPLPYVFSKNRAASLFSGFESLTAIIDRLPGLYLSSAAVADYHAFPAPIDQVMREQPPYRPVVYYCRYDFTFDEQGAPKIYEVNTAGPAGLVFTHFQRKAFLETSAGKALAGNFGFGAIQRDPFFTPGFFAKQLLGHAEEFLGHRPAGVGLVNSRYHTLSNELDLLERDLRAEGVRVVRAHVEDLSYSPDGLPCSGGSVFEAAYHKFYPRFDPDFEVAFSKRRDSVSGYMAALGSGKLFAVNSLASFFGMESKGWLAFLSDHANSGFFSAEERKTISELVPYTRYVHRLSADERELASAHKDGYIVKKCLETRGSGVFIGKYTGQAEWDELIGRPCCHGGHFVLQRFVPPETMTFQSDFPYPRGSQVYVNHACYVIRGGAKGLISRVSSKPVTNVGNGGMMLPTVVIDPGRGLA